MTNRTERTQRLINSNSAGHRGGVISLQSLHSISSSFSFLASPLSSPAAQLHPLPTCLFSFFFLFTHHTLFFCALLATSHFSIFWPFSFNSVLFTSVYFFPALPVVFGVGTSTMKIQRCLFNSWLHQSSLSHLTLYNFPSFALYS